jgi:hypothetical protein
MKSMLGPMLGRRSATQRGFLRQPTLGMMFEPGSAP